MANLAKLVVSLEAQSAKYVAELEKANAKLSRFERNQRRQLDQIARAFKIVATAAAGFVAIRLVSSMRELVSAAFESADALAKQADILGLSTGKLAAYQLAAKYAGSNSDALSKGIKRLQKAISDANDGLSTYTRAFDKLKLDPAELKQLTPDQQFEKLAVAFTHLETQTDRVSVAYDIFGGRNVQLLKLLDQVGGNMKAIEGDTRAFGIALSRVDAAKIEAANDATSRMKAAISGIATNIAVVLAPAIEHLANRIADVVKAWDGFKTQIKATLDLLHITDSFPFQKEIDALEHKKKLYQDQLEALKKLGGQGVVLEKLQFNINQTTARIAHLVEKQKEALGLTKGWQAQADAIAGIGKSADTAVAALTPLVNAEFTIQDRLDRILRPQKKFDIQPLERSFSLIDQKVQEVDQHAEQLGYTFTSFFEEAVLGAGRLSDALKGLLKDIERMFLHQFVSVPVGNFFGNLASSIFPSRDIGGPVMAGMTYEIGKGPYKEFFTPAVSGHITPAGGGGGDVNLYIESRADRAWLMATITPLVQRALDARDAKLRNDREIGR